MVGRDDGVLIGHDDVRETTLAAVADSISVGVDERDTETSPYCAPATAGTLNNTSASKHLLVCRDILPFTAPSASFSELARRKGSLQEQSGPGLIGTPVSSG